MTKNTLNLLLFYVPMYPSLNVTFIEIILVYSAKSTKTTKRKNSCYVSGLVFFWTLVRDIPVMTKPLFTGGTMWLETWCNLGLIKYWDTSDCLFSLLNHGNKSIHSLISIIPNPVTLQWFLTITLFQLQSPDSITETIPDLHTLSQMSELIFLMKRWNENWCCLRKYSL